MIKIIKRPLFYIFLLIVQATLCRNVLASEILFTIHGSNTVGASLGPALAAGFLEDQGASDVRVLSDKSINESMIKGFMAADNKEVAIKIEAHGSSTGFKGLHSGQADIAASSRRGKESERSLLWANGDLFSEQSEYVIGIDGLAIIVHPDNPVSALSVDQVARLFSGSISNWKQLGGRDLAVTPLARDEQSGTWDTFKSLVLAKKHKLENRVERFESNEVLSATVVSTLGGIGFVSLNTIGAAKPLKVADAAGKSLSPSVINVSTEDYLLSRRLYMYMPENNDKPMARAFLEYATGKEGQSIVESVGYVAQSIQPKVSDQSAMPADYQKLVNSFARLSVNFRFEQGKARLDNKAVRDIGRLADFLTIDDRSIRLIGFGDTNDDSPFSKTLAKLRADVVRRHLVRAGVPRRSIELLGYVPVVDKNLEVSQLREIRDRRVEVWLVVTADKNGLSG
ncbi:phosphate ABC transporter substrate-binding/OmpA family protein [Endozoicomonas ascidiicola]|uniref:phosphate ABC transporter substrate-binding/OmpA family protein n=1 Tax=Endozoicomonas ascidiicola TaxID=1698521 RepID=UPI00082A0436|nr:phosphate ABC transporter substrate-binding/OmpA family protein [Endozoicomonas ascidiicola]